MSHESENEEEKFEASLRRIESRLGEIELKLRSSKIICYFSTAIVP